jgi:aspartate kinase
VKLRVQKYGGSSLASTEQIHSIAKFIAERFKAGEIFILVVSAMGHTTDELCAMARKISLTPSRRELDMLLSTGERISMALMSMALNALSVPATSFTGSQAGILTDDSHNNARILDVTPLRLSQELKLQHVVVLAGFQGVNPHTKEITTLGRGGSDLTAVAMAHHFKVAQCEIMKDVDGVYSANPRLIPHAIHRAHLHFEHLLEITFWGSPILHYRSVELAMRLKMPILLQLAHGHANSCHANNSHTENQFAEARATLIDGDSMTFEKPGLVSINTHERVARLISHAADWPAAMGALEAVLTTHHLPWPQLLDTENQDAGLALYVTAPTEQLVSLEQVLKNSHKITVDPVRFASVSATAFGLISSELSNVLVSELKTVGIKIIKLNFSSRSITAFVAENDQERAAATWHKHI